MKYHSTDFTSSGASFSDPIIIDSDDDRQQTGTKRKARQAVSPVVIDHIDLAGPDEFVEGLLTGVVRAHGGTKIRRFH